MSATKSLPIEQNAFIRELVQKLLDSSSTQTGAAQRLGVSQSYLNEFIGGTRGAGPKLLKGLARLHPRLSARLLGLGEHEDEGRSSTDPRTDAERAVDDEFVRDFDRDVQSALVEAVQYAAQRGPRFFRQTWWRILLDDRKATLAGAAHPVELGERLVARARTADDQARRDRFVALNGTAWKKTKTIDAPRCPPPREGCRPTAAPAKTRPRRRSGAEPRALRRRAPHEGACEGGADGETALPVDLRSDSSVRRKFSESVLKRSVAAIRSYWQQRIFSGREVPPPELDSDAAVLRYVAKYRAEWATCRRRRRSRARRFSPSSNGIPRRRGSCVRAQASPPPWRSATTVMSSSGLGHQSNACSTSASTTSPTGCCPRSLIRSTVASSPGISPDSFVPSISPSVKRTRRSPFSSLSSPASMATSGRMASQPPRVGWRSTERVAARQTRMS